jgi:hypothetical protein
MEIEKVICEKEREKKRKIEKENERMRGREGDRLS